MVLKKTFDRVRLKDVIAILQSNNTSYTYCLIFNMSILLEKTQYLVVSKNSIRCKLAVEDKIIELGMNFTYLGVVITRDGNNCKGVRQQVIKGARISGCLRDVSCKNKYLRTKSKDKIYKAMIKHTQRKHKLTQAGQNNYYARPK